MTSESNDVDNWKQFQGTELGGEIMIIAPCYLIKTRLYVRAAEANIWK